MKWFASLTACCLSLFSFLNAEDFPLQEVIDLAARDTDVREKWIYDRGIEIRSQEIENTARLKEILARHSLPSGYEMEEGINAILQLVLHSSDLEFQKSFLEKVSSYGDLWSENSDLLTDRVLLRQGMPQRYGTHLYHENGFLIPYPIENPEAVDELRENIDEPPLPDYLDIMRAMDRASVQKSDADLYKIIFNMMVNLNKNPDHYLYYATFEPNGQQPIEDSGFLAFEDPALATAYILCKTSAFLVDAYYIVAPEDLSQHLSVIISPSSQNDVEVCTQTPIYIYWIPRGNYQPHEAYSSLFLNRLLASKEPGEPIGELKLSSAIEALVLGGSKLCIQGAGMEYEYKDTTLRNKLLSLLFFDVTLENELFE